LHLTEEEALFLNTRLRTPQSEAITWRMIRAYVAVRNRLTTVPARRVLPPHLAIAQQLIDQIAEQHERTVALEAAAVRTDERLEALENRESALHQLPAGIGAVQLAAEAGWLTQGYTPHNIAVIVACINEGFAEDGRLERRNEVTHGDVMRPAWYLTGRGVRDFYALIDGGRYDGMDEFTVVPTAKSIVLGHKNKSYVRRR
jgi:hypothetical protein